MIINVFENFKEAFNLEPISLTRPVFDLRCGAFTYLERIQKIFPESEINLFVRNELSELTRSTFNDFGVNTEPTPKGIWLLASVVWEKPMIENIADKPQSLFLSDGKIIGANISEEESNQWVKNGFDTSILTNENLTQVELPAKNITYLWDSINENEHIIKMDSAQFDLGRIHGERDEGVLMVGDENIYIGSNTFIQSGVVLDASVGPIIIKDNTTIMACSYLEGPLVIDNDCLIKVGSKIYGGTSIGPGCKIGGEVTESIFQSRSNKQHDGFIGHAYIGEWVNLGAGTNNSDLKNNYTTVTVNVNGNVIDSGSLFAGLFMGDHSKSGINTMFNTGTSVGVGCNVVGAGFPPKNVPSFSWVVNGKIRKYDYKKFLETAKIVKERRNQSISPEEEYLFQAIYNGSDS